MTSPLRGVEGGRGRAEFTATMGGHTGATVGDVYPEAFCRGGHCDDASTMTTECLLEADGRSELSVKVRFLHVGDQRVARIDGGMLAFTDSLTVDNVRHVTERRPVEREVAVGPIALGADPAGRCTPIVIDAGTEYEPIKARDGSSAGMILRSWDKIVGAVDVWTDPVLQGLYKIRIDIVNCSTWKREPRDQVVYRTLVSTHTVLRAHGGRFVSQIDPPAKYAGVAAKCRSIGTFPVLVGEAPNREMMLSSPVVMRDYPQASA